MNPIKIYPGSIFVQKGKSTFNEGIVVFTEDWVCYKVFVGISFLTSPMYIVNNKLFKVIQYGAEIPIGDYNFNSIRKRVEETLEGLQFFAMETKKRRYIGVKSFVYDNRYYFVGEKNSFVYQNQDVSIIREAKDEEKREYIERFMKVVDTVIRERFKKNIVRVYQYFGKVYGFSEEVCGD